MLLLVILPISACSDNTQGEQSQDTQDTGEVFFGYHPATRYGTLVSIDHDTHSVTLDVKRELNPDSDTAMIDGEIVCFIWNRPLNDYWSWFIENAEVGDVVRVLFHYLGEMREGDAIPVMSIILKGYEDVYHDYSRSGAQQEWERLR
jgi:hypothetical protein